MENFHRNEILNVIIKELRIEIPKTIKTELEKLLAGELYDYSDAEIAQLNGKAYHLSMKINNNLSFDNLEEMKLLQKELLPNMDETSTVLVSLRWRYTGTRTCCS